MDNIPVSQQAASNSNISTAMTDVPAVQGASQGQFKSRKATRVMDMVGKKFENTGGKIRAGLYSLQTKIKEVQVNENRWFNLLDSKAYLDPLSSEQHYQKTTSEFGKSYGVALQAYLDEKPGRHFSYLKGYQEDKNLQYSFKAEEGEKGELLVKVPTMPRTFNVFSKELTNLLKGHGVSGSLAKHLKDNLEHLGVKFDTLTGTTWIVRLTLPEPQEVTSQKTQPEIAGDDQIISSGSQFVHSDSDEKERIRLEQEIIHLIDDIRFLYETNKEQFEFCRLTKDIASLHKHYDKHWVQPKGLTDYAFSQVISMDVKDLEKHSNSTLSTMQRDLEGKNNTLATYINVTWESFPRSQDDRPLIKINGAYTISQIVEEALGIMDQPENRRFEWLKSRLFSSCYEQESRDRDVLFAELSELKVVGDSLKAYKNYVNVADNSSWFTNLAGECLLQGMPKKLLTFGRITLSSGHRKLWKEKLMEWGIERSHKICSTLNVSAMLSLVVGSDFNI